MSAPVFIGMARGAMDVFMEYLADRGAITFTGWTKAAEAPVVHHQLAKAQFSLEVAEMYTGRLCQLLRDADGRTASMAERVRARAWLGQVTAHSRACVNQLFEGQRRLTGAARRRSAAILPGRQRPAPARGIATQYPPTNSMDALLVGLEPNTELL